MNRFKLTALPVFLLVMSLSGCATTSQPDCPLPDTKNLRTAMEKSKVHLNQGCVALYDAYFDRLLTVAEAADILRIPQKSIYAQRYRREPPR